MKGLGKTSPFFCVRRFAEVADFSVAELKIQARDFENDYRNEGEMSEHCYGTMNGNFDLVRAWVRLLRYGTEFD
jgi:hypothetical protein